jgi:hypothetical protein
MGLNYPSYVAMLLKTSGENLINFIDSRFTYISHLTWAGKEGFYSKLQVT